MHFLLLRRAQGNVGAAAIGSPTLFVGPGAKIRVGIGNAFVNVILIGVLWGTGIGIANFPEFLDELVAGVIGGQLEEGALFLAGNNIGDVPLQPFLVTLLQLLRLRL